MEQQRLNVGSIKNTLPKKFDQIIWEIVNNRFGMSKVTEDDWSMIHKLIITERERFISLVNGITTEQFVSGMRYVPNSKQPENVYTGWERTLSCLDRSESPSYHDGRASEMNLCVNRAIRRINIYCDAEIAIRAGRFEDAARSYEFLTMYEEAGRIRKMALHERNTSRNVSVNMNQLIDQVRQGGLAFAYKCPSCGGSINIDKDFNPGMKVCGFCGTPLDTSVIASLIKNI
ncbi:MAG: hypothetical protein MIO90_02760 [Methanomassiliicoccales archaeon]|nr:hypothetical protein [Methanomassiliicoccales archaeon]